MTLKYIHSYVLTYITYFLGYIHTNIHKYISIYNIKMTKAYRTVSHEALCVLTGTMPIDLKIEQTARIYQLTKENDKGKTQFDKDMEVRDWQHPAEASISSTDEKEDKGSMHIYTDGSKTDKGVGSGIAIFESG
jgi:hypothetical protein